MTDKQFNVITNRFRFQLDTEKLRDLDDSTTSVVLDLLINGGQGSRAKALELLREKGI